MCVCYRAFIEFQRDPADGSSSRILPAVYLALKLRFVPAHFTLVHSHPSCLRCAITTLCQESCVLRFVWKISTLHVDTGWSCSSPGMGRAWCSHVLLLCLFIRLSLTCICSDYFVTECDNFETSESFTQMYLSNKLNKGLNYSLRVPANSFSF